MKVHGWTVFIVLLLTITGCGVMGPPVPPDSIGVNVKRHNDTVERERRVQESKKRQDRDESAKEPRAPVEQTPSLSEGALLQGERIQPAARPNNDFLVRPR